MEGVVYRYFTELGNNTWYWSFYWWIPNHGDYRPLPGHLTYAWYYAYYNNGGLAPTLYTY